MLFSKTTGGFYILEVHGQNIPNDAVEVSDETYADLMRHQAEGKQIIGDSEGNPVAVDQIVTAEQVLIAKGKSVDYALQEAQTIAMQFFMKGDAFPAEWKKYVADLEAVKVDLSLPIPVKPE